MPTMLTGVRVKAAAVAALSYLQIASPACAAEVLSGDKSVVLIAHDGSRQTIGKVSFSREGNAASFSIKLEAPPFSEAFLSMRPFRCISLPKRMWCHLPYPYDNPQTVTADDLTSLEYALMFLWRPYEKVGVDAWDGLYFKLTVQADGSLRGKLHEVDFNTLAVPPVSKSERLISSSDLTPAQPGQHAFDEIELR